MEHGQTSTTFVTSEAGAENMAPQRLAERHAQRANVYRLLADCFAEPERLERALLPRLSSAMAGCFVECLPDLDRMKCHGAQEGEPLLALRVAHAQLFVGPNELLAPPYGSVYLEGERRLMEPSTLAVMEEYREAGLLVSEELHQPPDHIASELELLYFLIFQHLESGEEAYLTRQLRFLDRHLGRWCAPFCERIQNAAVHPFYDALATLTERFVGLDHAWLRELAADQSASKP